MKLVPNVLDARGVMTARELRSIYFTIWSRYELCTAGIWRMFI